VLVEIDGSRVKIRATQYDMTVASSQLIAFVDVLLPLLVKPH
jgi:hypothetical protein